jgi:uncharacterized protein Yka (UPF0111/DUF47 family)
VRQGFWDRLFPFKRDFYKMISDQARATSQAVEMLRDWLESRSQENYQRLLDQVKAEAQSRINMENELIEAFTTPFDRQDIYSLSVEMSRILVYAQSTLIEMEAFGVAADSTIVHMVQQLVEGTKQLAEAITLLKEDPRQAQDRIGRIRQVQLTMEDNYRTGMVELFQGPDLIHAMKYREVYHHIKDAATFLGYTTNVLHRIIVRLI